MKRVLGHIAKQIGYFILTILVIIRNAWLVLKHTNKNLSTTFLDTHPKLNRLSKSLFRTRLHRGSAPKHPTTLAVVLVSALSQGDADETSLCRVIEWYVHNHHHIVLPTLLDPYDAVLITPRSNVNRARQRGFHVTFVYDPRSECSIRYPSLLEKIQKVDPSHSVRIWKGWHVPMDTWAELQQHNSSDRPLLGVAILSAEDAEWPLAASALDSNTSAVVARRIEDTATKEDIATQHDENHEIENICTTYAVDTTNGRLLEEALDAPNDIKARLSSVAGPLVRLEPDIILVFGESGRALTMAGFPQWMTRTSEFFHGGRLIDVTDGVLDSVLKRFLSTRQRFGA